MPLPFHDRRDAGRQLAATFEDLKRRSDVVVFGLPRGGVPVAYEVAEAVGAPLDVYLVRKLGVPGHEELAMGAIAMGGLRVLNQDLARELGVSAAAIDEVEAREGQELARRERLYRGDRPRPDLRGKVAILVDDGLATGSTMAAAARSIRALEPARVIAAVPVASADVCAAMRELVDEMICLETPEPFAAVGLWYDDFSPTSDDEVQTLLRLAAERQSPQIDHKAIGPSDRNRRAA
jgi:predicted phosphoribosyltransferase